MKTTAPFWPLMITGVLGILITSKTENMVAKGVDFWFPRSRPYPRPRWRAVLRRVVHWYMWVNYGVGVVLIVAALLGKMGLI